MKFKLALTGILVATFTTPAFAKYYQKIKVPEGTIIVEQIGETHYAPATTAKYLASSNNCSAQAMAETQGIPLGNVLKSGGVVFDDGLSGNISTGDIELDMILNLGKQAWKLVHNNAPVVSTKLVSANALPQGVQCWTQLERWQGIVTADYQVSFKTVANKDAARYVARVTYAYGGSLNGKGRYIANASVQNKEVNVNWSNQLNVDVEIPQVLNGGSKENPVAVMQININVENKNRFIPLKHLATSVSFVVYGDGRPMHVLQ